MKARLTWPTTIALAALSAPGQLLAESNVQLRILETTDIHVQIVDYDYFQDSPSMTSGLARTAALIQSARAEVSNSILVDNGDLLQGNPLGDFIARQRGLQTGDVHPVYKAMNQLDYTVGNVGNHEFNYGLDFLGQSIAGANFPYISANVFHDDGDDDPDNDVPYFDQYLIVERTLTAEDGSEHDINIGFIGFVPPQIMQWDFSNLRGRVTARDIVETALELVPRMKAEGADIVVAIPHSGLAAIDRRGMDENATYYLSQVPGIDAILFGHSHRVFPGDRYADIAGVDITRGTINGIPSSMPGFWGSHLGYVDLQLVVSDTGEWAVVDGIGAVRPIFKRDGQDIIPLVEPMEEILAAVQEEHEATIEFMRTAVGEITVPITTFFALVRDDPSVQIVTNAQRRYVERIILGTEFEGMPLLSASAPFKAGGRGGGGYYTDIEAGEIALKHIADLYIYPNTLRVVTMTGAQVREWLEMSAAVFNRIDPHITGEQELINPGFPPYNFDVIDGVSYAIDVTEPARYDRGGNLVNADSHRIVDLSYAGKPIDPEQVFIVATNNYRAGGGGNFPGMDGSNIVIEAPDTNRNVLADYVFELRTVDPSADGNWSFAPISADVNVTMISAPNADKALGPGSPIEKIGMDSEGFGRYRIHFGN
ncbi:MAG: bifunctional 2',3'-cyclic-nucleotide 2'-phosphodiesterase/3'-nucleotidase [Woeseiaceae bacterium]